MRVAEDLAVLKKQSRDAPPLRSHSFLVSCNATGSFAHKGRKSDLGVSSLVQSAALGSQCGECRRHRLPPAHVTRGTRSFRL